MLWNYQAMAYYSYPETVIDGEKTTIRVEQVKLILQPTEQSFYFQKINKIRYTKKMYKGTYYYTKSVQYFKESPWWEKTTSLLPFTLLPFKKELSTTNPKEVIQDLKTYFKDKAEQVFQEFDNSFPQKKAS